MPRPKGSPKTKGSGRKKGTTNKVVADIKELAQQFGPAAIQTLVELMMEADFEPTRVAAAKELLDRGYGKSAQVIAGNIAIGPSEELKELMRRYDGQSRSIPQIANGAVRGSGVAAGQHLLDS